ncbi:Nif3-like dinuclear metal center hexameric protein, partial [Streptomyces sp. NPDC127044]
MPRLSEVIAALDTLWPPERAEGWDAVGTVCGEPDQEITRVLFAVDPVREIVDEAVKLGANLLVTHHPLYLRGTTTVAADTFKGRVVHTLIKNDIALHVAHTNADRADPGVSDALAGALDLRVVRPLVPDPTDPEGRRGPRARGGGGHPQTGRAQAPRARRRPPPPPPPPPQPPGPA